MKKKKLLWQLPFLAFLIIGTVVIVGRQKSVPYQHDEGRIFGTTYHITYQSDDNLKKEIEEALKAVDQEFSMFNPQSTVALINEGKRPTLSDDFLEVFQLAQQLNGQRRTGSPGRANNKTLFHRRILTVQNPAASA